ncbi:MAG: BBP7 family outer membrane beta-barrel protein [Gemmataceae bacterium]
MRKRMWGAIAGVAVGAGGAWGQSPTADPPAPAALGSAAGLVPAQGFGPVPPGVGLPPGGPGAPATGIHSLPPAIMPPIAPGPTGDPQGFGPMAGFGPPPGPMYPPPGPYGAPLWEPAGGPGMAGGAGGAPHFWMTYEYLLMYSKSQSYPAPLLTTSAPSNLGLPSAGSTLVLAGGGDISANPLNGGRVTAGFYGDADRRFGFEGSGFVTENGVNRVTEVTSASGIPLLARPFRDSAAPNFTTTLVVASPTVGQGRASILNSTQVWGVEADALVNLYRSEPGCSTGWSIEWLAGYRYMELDEVFRASSVTRLTPAGTIVPNTTVGPFGQVTVTGVTVVPGTVNVGGLTVPSGHTVTITDTVRTRNQFQGFNTGLRGEIRRGMFTFGASGKIAIGHMRQELEITGYTDIHPGAVSAPIPLVSGRTFGGLYANASNIGRYNNDEFAVIPELNLNLGLAVTQSLSFHVGYNLIYIDKVARPSNEFTTTVNSATVPFSPNFGTNRPLVRQTYFNQDDFWLMGLNTGFTLRF